MKGNYKVGDAGVGVLEMALVLPLFLLIVFTSIEISRAFKARQMTQTLSRVVGDIAFRECAADTGIDAEACLYDVVLDRAMGQAGVLNRRETAESGVGIVISVYSQPAPGDPITLEGIACQKRDTAECTAMSRFTVTEFQNTSEYGSALAEHGVILVAEVYYPHRMLFLPQVFPGLTAGFYYDAYFI